MPHIARIVRFATTIALAATAAAACSGTTGPASTSALGPVVDQALATRIADQALAAFNEGDYEGFTADWSDAMKAAIKESDFLAVREQVIRANGRYVSHGTPTGESRRAGTFRWAFPVTFERGTGTFWIAFFDGSTKVDGSRFE